jgi:outer membrane biosynthesis protein TonB
MLDSLRDRGVKFRSLAEAIDTDTPTRRAMWQMIGVLAELERSLISEGTCPGGGVTNPVPINQPEPEYSEEARKAKRQGEVLVSLVVDEHGKPIKSK